MSEQPRLARRFQQLCSIKGIADASAIQILGELEALPADMTARQRVAHAGLDPRHFESGTSIHKHPRISKAGNEHPLDRGKTKMQAIVAVMRKLIHSAYGMFKHDHLFDGDKFFALTACQPTEHLTLGYRTHHLRTEVRAARTYPRAQIRAAGPTATKTRPATRPPG